MTDAPPPDVHLSQSLAVLRQCITTLNAAAARAPTATHTLQETVGALRGVEDALHRHRDALRRDHHFATVGRPAAGLSHEIRNPLGILFLHIDLLEEEFRTPSAESPRFIPQTFPEIRIALARLEALVQDYLALVRVGARRAERPGLEGGRAGVDRGGARPGSTASPRPRFESTVTYTLKMKGLGRL